MTTVRQNPESLPRVCQIIYESGSQYDVYRFIEEHHPYTKWRWCDACEHDTPIHEDSCLVCGSYCHAH